MKLELYVWHHLLDGYTKFQIDISKHVEKSPENPIHAKIIAKVSKIWFLRKTEFMPGSIQRATHVPTLKNLSWFMRPWLQKMSLTYFGLQTRSKWPNYDKTQTRHGVPPTECIYQVLNWYLKPYWKKSGKRGRTGGQTGGQCHGIIRPIFKRVYEK